MFDSISLRASRFAARDGAGTLIAVAVLASCLGCAAELGAQAPIAPEQTLSLALCWDDGRRDVSMDGAGNLAVSRTTIGYAELLQVPSSGVEDPVATLGLKPFYSLATRTGVALDLFGRGAVGWVGAGEGRRRRLFVRSFEAASATLGVSREVDDEQANDALEVRVAADLDGKFAISWQRDLGRGWRSFWTRDFSPGTGALSIARWVADRAPTGEEEVSSDLATLGGGRRAVVWDAPLVDQQGLGVVARILTGDGGTVGAQLRVNEYEGGDQHRPSVAGDGRGRFVVSWEGLGSRGERRGVFARVFDGTGIPLTDEIPANSEVFATPAEQADVAMDPDGNFLVAYRADTHFSEPERGVRLRAFRADGTALGGEIRVDEGASAWPQDPAVAISAAGIASVVWTTVRFGIFAEFAETSWRRFSLPCAAGPSTLCLGARGRFLVRAFWEAADATRGFGRAVAWTRESGSLAFFSPESTDLVVKVLDACAHDGTHWFFAAGLTDVRSTLVITDTWTGQTRALRGGSGERFPPGRFVGELGSCSVEQPAGVASGEPSTSRLSLEEIGPAGDALLLRGGRIRIVATWRSPAGDSGFARAVRASETDGIFWFFSPGNPELVVKLLDGCSVNDRLWLFVGGLTDLAVELQVTDLETGRSRTYLNQPGEPFVPVFDLTTFASCP